MALGDVSGLLEPLVSTAAGMSGAFVPLAQTLLALSVTLALLFAVYDWWLGAASAALARIVRAGLVLTVPLYLFAGGNWQSSVQTLTHFFSQELPAPILGSAGQGGGPEAIKSTIEKLSKSMFPNSRPAKGAEKSTWEKVVEFIKSDETFGGAILSSLTQALLELILFAVAFFVSLALVFALYGPLLAFQIGAIFGPLLIAFMPFQPLSHLARNWLQFMLSQGFALVVGITTAAIGAVSIESFSDQMATLGRAEGVPWFEELAIQFGGFMASAAVLVFVGFMLFKADDIAAAMIGGGGAGAGGGAR